MRWWNRFGSSLLFALLVGGIYPIYLGFTDFILGRKLAFAAYVLTSAAIYLLGIAHRPTHGLGAGFAIVAIGTSLLLGGASGPQLVLATGLLIGVFRSGLLQANEDRGSHDFGGDFGRGFAREVLFIGGGLALATILSRGEVLPGALALWGFYLTQSGFFLIGGESARARVARVPKRGPDPFTAAVKRAHEVLAEGGSSCHSHKNQP
jgi:hypothetical protein